MKSPLVRSVIESQVALFAFLSVCIVIEPTYLLRRNEGGLSNFGVHATTVVPYTLAFSLCAAFLARAASLVVVSTRTARTYRAMLWTLSCLLALVLVSTYAYKTGDLLHGVHVAAGVAIVCFESAASIWIVAVIARDGWSRLVLGVQLCGLLLAALTFFGQLHVLFAAQLLTSLAFGVLLVASARRVDATAAVPA